MCIESKQIKKKQIKSFEINKYLINDKNNIPEKLVNNIKLNQK